MKIQDAIAALLERRPLESAEIQGVFDTIMRGEATPAQIGGLLIALRAKGESVEEIVGAARAMRGFARTIQPQRQPLVDTCGTGGDGSHTFNVSTAAALIAAGAGVGVAKHGNRAMSGRVGGADVLELLGVRIDLEPERVTACIEEVGIGFLFAQVFHPAMKYAAGPRRELGVRTVFNLLGPLCNPAGVRRQVVGLFARDWLEPMARALDMLGCDRALVVHGDGGLDELSLSGPTEVVELRAGEFSRYAISPEDVGLERRPLASLQVEDGEASARAIRGILDGEPGAKADIAVLNAAAVLYVADAAGSIAEGVAGAREAIHNGAAAAKLQQWIEAAR